MKMSVTIMDDNLLEFRQAFLKNMALIKRMQKFLKLEEKLVLQAFLIQLVV